MFNYTSNVKIIPYRGYTNCIRIFNQTTEVIIIPAVGGRVLAYSLKGDNIIYRNPYLDGKSFDDFLRERFDPDGGRFDLGFETLTAPIHDILWMGPYKVEITGSHSVKLASGISHLMGVQIEREFILDSESSHLVIRQTMINRCEKETDWFFWGRTLVPIGGKLVLPMNPDSKYPQGWGQFAGNPWKFNFYNPTHPQVEIREGRLIFHADTTPNAFKFATDANQGWMVYTLSNLVFVKKFEVDPHGIYTDDQTTIVYTHGKDFIEMEPSSPHAFLMPGERYTFDEHWWLLENSGNTYQWNDIVETAHSVMDRIYR